MEFTGGPTCFWATGASSGSGLKNHPRISFKHSAVMGEPKAGVFVTHPSSFTTQLFWMGMGCFCGGFFLAMLD